MRPAFSRTFASDGVANAVLLEICSAMGGTYAKSPESDTSGKQTGKMDDCPYCRVHFDLPVLPPAPDQGVVPLHVALELDAAGVEAERVALDDQPKPPIHEVGSEVGGDLHLRSQVDTGYVEREPAHDGLEGAAAPLRGLPHHAGSRPPARPR